MRSKPAFRRRGAWTPETIAAAKAAGATDDDSITSSCGTCRGDSTPPGSPVPGFVRVADARAYCCGCEKMIAIAVFERKPR